MIGKKNAPSFGSGQDWTRALDARLFWLRWAEGKSKDATLPQRKKEEKRHPSLPQH